MATSMNDNAVHHEDTLREELPTTLADVASGTAPAGMAAEAPDTSPLTSPPTSPAPSNNSSFDTSAPITELYKALMEELRKSREARFHWVHQAHQDWKEWVERREQWDNRVHRELSRLQNTGLASQAEELSLKLLKNKLVSRPGRFELLWTTGYGNEKLLVVAQGDDFHSEPATERSSALSEPRRSTRIREKSQQVSLLATDHRAGQKRAASHPSTQPRKRSRTP